jgi:hypothetical protein
MGLFISGISVWLFCLRFSTYLFNSSFISYVVFFISYLFFIVSFVSLWCLLKSSLSSFSCFCLLKFFYL